MLKDGISDQSDVDGFQRAALNQAALNWNLQVCGDQLVYTLIELQQNDLY